jgi:hypothetical protein
MMNDILQLIINIVVVVAITIRVRRMISRSLARGMLGRLRDRAFERYMRWKTPKWQQALAKDSLFINVVHRLQMGDEPLRIHQIDMAAYMQRIKELPFDALDFSPGPTGSGKEMYAEWVSGLMSKENDEPDVTKRPDVDKGCPYHLTPAMDEKGCNLCQQMRAAYEADAK